MLVFSILLLVSSAHAQTPFRDTAGLTLNGIEWCKENYQLYYFIGNDFPIKEIDQQVRTIDFMPTILEILNIPLSEEFEKIDGVSLLPLIQGKIVSEKMAFSETGNPLKERSPPKNPNVKSIRTSKWKLILNQFNDTREFYDLKNDPEEKNNLSGKGLEKEDFFWDELKKHL